MGSGFHLIGLILGGICGAVELYLIHVLVKRVSAGEGIPIWVIPLKMLTLGLFFVPVALFAREQLAREGIAAAAVLIGGSIGLLAGAKRGGGGKCS